MLKTQIYFIYLHQQYDFEFNLTISKFPNICPENIIEADLIITLPFFTKFFTCHIEYLKIAIF